MDSTISEQSITPDSSKEAGLQNRRRPMPRKGHIKSRRGCVTCKKRKVKCDESVPSCGSCERLGLVCNYPYPIREAIKRADAALTVQRSLRETPTLTIKDLGSFQNFLNLAHPTIPADGASIWQTVGQMSHHYDFLAHATLALGASHLGAMNHQESYSRDGLRHRYKAIQLMNNFWQQDGPNRRNADALFAATVILSFQTGFISDALYDQLTMSRGCYVVGHRFIRDAKDSIFDTMNKDVYITESDRLAITLQDSSLREDPVVSDFRDSLSRVASESHSETELDYIATLQNVAKYILSDAPESYRESSYIFEKLGEMSNKDFMALIDPTHMIGRLILLHLFFLDCNMSMKVIRGAPTDPAQRAKMRIRNWVVRKNMTRHWMQQLYDGLPKNYKAYGSWLLDLIPHEGHIRDCTMISTDDVA